MNTNKIPESFGNFNREIARELLNLIEKAHEQFARAVKEPNYLWEDDFTEIELNNTKYQILANLGFAQYFFLKRRRVPFGFIARKEDTQDIYIVFRGTSNAAEWVSNFKLIQSSYKKSQQHSLCKSIPNHELGNIHRGFYTTYTRTDLGSLLGLIYDLIPHNNYDSIRDKIQKTLKQCPTNSRVFVTGHSLGGALASICTLHIHKSEEIAVQPILYSFASPRVGDEYFAQNFDNLECYRIANSEDIVTKIPLPSLLLASARLPGQTGATCAAARTLIKSNYQHIGIPIYFTIYTDNIVSNHNLSTYLQAL